MPQSLGIVLVLRLSRHMHTVVRFGHRIPHDDSGELVQPLDHPLGDRTLAPLDAVQDRHARGARLALCHCGRHRAPHRLARLHKVDTRERERQLTMGRAVVTVAAARCHHLCPLRRPRSPPCCPR